ncbi:hypothetical protein [Desulfocicer niacini]
MGLKPFQEKILQQLIRQENKQLFNWIQSNPDAIPGNILLQNNLDSLATIDDDALQKRFLKTLIRNYILLEKKVDSLLKNTLPATKPCGLPCPPSKRFPSNELRHSKGTF